jgi:hypothetical protein
MCIHILLSVHPLCGSVCVFLGMNECSSFLFIMNGIGVFKSPVNYAMIAKTREYVMIYRGPGFLAVV